MPGLAEHATNPVAHAVGIPSLVCVAGTAHSAAPTVPCATVDPLAMVLRVVIAHGLTLLPRS